MNFKEGGVVVQVSEGRDTEDHGGQAVGNDSQSSPLVPADGKSGKVSGPSFAITSMLLDAAAILNEGDRELCSHVLKFIVLWRVHRLCVLALLVYLSLGLCARVVPAVEQLMGDGSQLIFSPTMFLQVFLAGVIVAARVRIHIFAKKAGSDEKWVQPLASLRKFWRSMVAAYCWLWVAAAATFALSRPLSFLDTAPTGEALYYLPGE